MTILEKWFEPKPVKLTIEDFIHLDATGAFRDYAKTELIDGVIVAMDAQWSQHARVKSRLFRRLADAIDRTMPGYEAWSEVLIAIPPGNLPEPDIVVTRFKALGRVPVPVETVALIVEIADTTKRYDLGTKARLYGGGRVPEYWIVDIDAAILHQLWQPTSDGFDGHREIALGSRAEAATIGGLSVETGDL